MTAHLLDLGHRAIGFIRGRPEHGATEQRYLGFTDEMRARGVPVKSQWVQTGNFIFADGLACAERMLRGTVRPSAVFASNDDMAAAVICAARQRGLELPKQLSVVGFDDAPVATMVWPQLTTIRQPVRQMARVAAEHHPAFAASPRLAAADSTSAAELRADPAQLHRACAVLTGPRSSVREP